MLHLFPVTLWEIWSLRQRWESHRALLVPVLIEKMTEKQRPGWDGPQTKETEMTTRPDQTRSFSTLQTPPVAPRQEKGLQSRGVGWEQQPASAPSSPCRSFPAFLTAALLHPPSHGEGNMPHGKSREAGRAGLLQKELTQHWERPSCNKAPKARAQQQSTKARSRSARPAPAAPGTSSHTWAPAACPCPSAAHLAISPLLLGWM